MTAASHPQTRILAGFLALSAAVHFIVGFGMRFELALREPEPVTLQARLEPAKSVAPRVKAQKPKATVRRTAGATPMAEPSSASAVPANEEAAEEPQSIARETTDEKRIETARSNEPAPVAASAAPARRVIVRLPSRGEISYAVYLGRDKLNIGQTMQAWVISDDSYRLTSRSEPTGLASLFIRQELAYESVGKLTAAGLQPAFFAARRVRGGRMEEAQADFDWEAMRITLRKARDEKNVALPPHTQDLMSFMYQLGRLPLERGRVDFDITNGSKLERYELEIGAEEVLDTPFGKLRALPVKQVRRAGEESVELWLASEYRFLPVKIRFYDRQGAPSGEQLVSNIRVSDD